MTTEQYAEKLRAFNSTEKYKKELEFLNLLIGSEASTILDYGAGLGYAVEYLISQPLHDLPWKIIHAIEPAGYYEGNPNCLKIKEIGNFYDCVYFMHSIAHIQDIEKVLLNVRNNLLVKGGEVVVITPNVVWINNENNHEREYVPDDTVIQDHYYAEELMHLFAGLMFDVVHCGQFGKVDEYHIHERLFLVAKKP